MADTVEVAPVIQSFEVLSDRISNLEDSANLLLSHAIFCEVRTHGPLNHRLLSLPCPVTRHKDLPVEFAPADAWYREGNSAPARVSALVLEFQGVPILHRCHGEDAFCKSIVASDTYLTPTEVTRIAGTCCTTRAAGMHSTHEWVCEEIISRRLEHRRLSSPVLGRCVTFLPCFKGHEFAVLITCALPVDFSELTRETTFLIAEIYGERPSSAAAYDCAQDCILDYQNVCAKLYTGNRAHRMAAEAFCRRHRLAIGLLKDHLFFSGVVDNLPVDWETH
jgi:hypothetical protein